MPNYAIVIHESEIPGIIQRLAHEIGDKYAGKDITLVGILKGAAYFIVFLSQAIWRDGRVKTCRIDFMCYESYGDGQEAGKLRLVFDTSQPMTGRDVIITEDVSDTKNTLHAAYRHIGISNPKSLAICAFLSKPEKDQHKDVPLDFVGREVPKDYFLVGFGLDDKGAERNNPNVVRIIQ